MIKEKRTFSRKKWRWDECTEERISCRVDRATVVIDRETATSFDGGSKLLMVGRKIERETEF
jgi:hypothetical protein